MAVLCQGLPQLVRLNEEVVQPDPEAPDFAGSPVLCRVRMLNETPVVPDLESVERQVADILDAEAASE